MADVPTTALDLTTPSGSTKINKGDDAQRTFKTQVQEIVSVDHKMETSGQGSDWGQHKQVTLQEQADLGTGAVGTTILGSQTVSGKGELVFVDEDDNDVQITACGYINTSGLKAGALPTNITVASANIVDDSIVNADIKSNAAIVYSKLNIADADLTIAKTNGLATALAAKDTAPTVLTQASATPGTTYTLAHGLGAIPSRIEAYVEESSIRYPVYAYDIAGWGTSIEADATNVKVLGSTGFARSGIGGDDSITTGTLKIYVWA